MELDDLDIYEDLDTFQKEEEKKSTELLSLESKYNNSLKTVEALQVENANLKKQINRISINFQNLLDTAKAEIKRKDKQIEQLRKEKDDICFRRKLPRAEYADVAETSHSNSRWSNNDTADLPKNYKAEYDRRMENSAVHEGGDPKATLSNNHHTMDARGNAHHRHDGDRRNPRRDDGTGPQNECDSNSEIDRRRHTQKDHHEFTRYRTRSREREGSGRGTTRGSSHCSESKSTSRVRREERHSRSKRSYADEKERNSYSNKNYDSSRRQFSHEKMRDRPKHSREVETRSNNGNYSSERRRERKKSIEDANKKSNDAKTRDKCALHKNEQLKNAPDTGVKIADVKIFNTYMSVEHIKDVENKGKNAKDLEQVPIRKVVDHDNCSKRAKDLKAANENTISYDNLSTAKVSSYIEEKSTAENLLTKKNLLELETATDKNTNCIGPIDGMVTPKKASLFDRLFGSTPSNAESVNSTGQSDVIVMKGSSSSATTSPSNYTDTSEQIAATTSQKSNIDDSFVPIKSCERQFPKESENVITLSDTSQSTNVHIPGLGKTFINDNFSAEQNAECTIADRDCIDQGSKENMNAKATKEVTNSMKDSVGTENHSDNSAIIVLSDDDDFIEIENILTRNDNIGAPKVDTNNLALQCLTKCELNVNGNNGERKTLVDVRLPNIYEIRAQQRLLRIESAKNAAKDAKPSLMLKTTITNIKENESATKKSPQHSKNLAENCKDSRLQKYNIESSTNLAKTQNPVHGQLEVGVEMDTSATVIAEKSDEEICVSDINKDKNVEKAESTKLHINSPDAAVSQFKTANPNKTKADLSKLKPETEGTAENAVISIQAKSDVIGLMQGEYSCQSPASESETASKIQGNDVEAEFDCQRTGKKSVVLNETETIPEVDESLIKSSSELLANNEKSENQSNLLPEICVIEEMVPDKSQATNSMTTAEGYTLVIVDKEIPAVIDLGDQPKNNNFTHVIDDSEKDYVSQREITLSTRSNAIEENCNKEINAMIPDSSAVEMKSTSESLIGKDVDNTTVVVQTVLNEEKLANDRKEGEGQKDFVGNKIMDEQKIVQEQRSEQKMGGQEKMVDELKVDDEQKQTNKKKLVEVQREGNEMQQVGPAKLVPTESLNERTNVIENGKNNTNNSEIIVPREPQSNRSDSNTKLESKEDSSKTTESDHHAIIVNANNTHLSAVANSDSNMQFSVEKNKQTNYNVESAAVNGESLKMGENREKPPSVIVESESKELKDAVGYLVKSMVTQGGSRLDGMEMEAQVQCENPSEKAAPKVVEVPSKQNECTTDDRIGDQNFKIKSTELLKNTKPEHNALIDNMKRAEIMHKYKIPKISAKRKRENDADVNNLKESSENKEDSENRPAKSLQMTAKVEEDISRNRKKSKTEETSTKLDLAAEENKIVKIAANIESELLDKQLLNGQTPEEEQALSAEQAKSERIIKEIDNWARRKVGKASEIIESAIIIESTLAEKMPHPIEKLTQDEINLITTSIALEEEEEHKTGMKVISYGNDKTSIPKDQLPILGPQLQEQREQVKGKQLDNNDVVQLEDVNTTPGHLPNKRCKYEKSADTIPYDAHTKQKTDHQKLPEESKNENITHQISIIKFPIINKKKPTTIKERRRSQPSALGVFSEENNAKDVASPDVKSLNAVATEDEQRGTSQVNVESTPEENIAKDLRVNDGNGQGAVADEKSAYPPLGVDNQLNEQNLSQLEQIEKAITTSTKVQKVVKNTESVNKVDNKTSQSVQLESKTKISLAKGKVCTTSQGELMQDTSEMQNQRSKCDSTGKLMGSLKLEKEKRGKDVVGKKRATEKQATALSKEIVKTHSNEKRAKLEMDTRKVETVHKTPNTTKDKQVASTKQQKTTLTAAGSSKVVSSCSDIGTRHSKTVTSIADKIVEHKLVKRRRSDASTSDECEVMPKSRNRKRCKMRIEDSEEEGEGVCSTAQLSTQKPDEVIATDLVQNIDILDILQNESIDVLPAPQTPTSLPANISQDEQYKELDTNLELMFASPKVGTQTRAVPKLFADAAESLTVTLLQPVEQSLHESPVSPLPLTGTELISMNTRHAVDFHVSDTFLSDISSNSFQVSDMNVIIDETNHSEMNVNSTHSDSNSSTKHISLGSSDYRFEKVSDNVVNLFITRKRRGKRKQAAATTTTAKDTIPTT